MGRNGPPISSTQLTLTPDEHRELLALQQRLEALHAARMKALAQLAEQRGVTLTAVMDQLGIQLPDHPQD